MGVADERCGHRLIVKGILRIGEATAPHQKERKSGRRREPKRPHHQKAP
jgi:hypothetical protein